MIKKVLLVFITIIAAVMPVAADNNELVFSPVGGGKYIYCNNCEGIMNTDLADNSYDAPAYIMNNNSLTDGRYEIYLTHFNMTTIETDSGKTGGSDIVLDVVFTAKEDSVITIERSTCEVPENTVFYKNGVRGIIESEWSSLFSAADMLGENIHELHTGRIYESRKISPVTISLQKGEELFLSRFTENYRSVPFPKHVFLSALFDIESGNLSADVIALKAKDDIFDRSAFVRTAAFGTYKRDRTQKGIADSLPESECSLSFTVSDAISDGDYLPVVINNQYTEGNVCYEWCTHLNPQDDIYSKTKTAESDVLRLSYKDPSKLTYYGSGVLDNEKNDVWIFDPFHSDTKEYTGAASGYTAENYIPNYPLLAERDNQGYACSMGNYGVFDTYHLKVRNDSSRDRYFNYVVTTTANVVVRVADENDATIGHVTSKGFSLEQTEDTMASIFLPSGEEKIFSVSVMLPPQNYGGIRQSFVITDEKRALSYVTDDKVYPILLSGENVPTLLKKSNKATRQRFIGTENNLEAVQTDFGYAAIYNNVAGQPNFYANNWQSFCKVFLFNKRFELIGEYVLSSPPLEIGYAVGSVYVKTAREGILRMNDKVPPSITGFTNIPRATSHGSGVLFSRKGVTLSYDGDSFDEILFQDNAPPFVEQADGYIYYCDGKSAGISSDGVYYSSYKSEVPIESIKIEKGLLVINDETSIAPFPKDTPIVLLSGKYLSFDSVPTIINDRTMVPMRFIFECFGMSVSWDGENRQATAILGDKTLIFTIGEKSVNVNGEMFENDVESTIISDRTYIPLRFLSETLGYNVAWDEETRIITID